MGKFSILEIIGIILSPYFGIYFLKKGFSKKNNTEENNHEKNT